MKRPTIKSFDDPTFLKLGLVLIGIGILVYLASIVFEFPGIIALRGGGGLGFIICATYFITRALKKKK